MTGVQTCALPIYVPEELQRRTHADIQGNIPTLQKIFGDNFIIIDNTNTPDLSLAQKKINRFMSAPPSKPAALEWIKQQNMSRKGSFGAKMIK